MGVIEYLKKEAKIRRPFLYILSSALSFLVGCIIMYALEHNKVNKLRERVSEITTESIKRESEWNKRLSEATKKVTILKPDGTKEIVETTKKDVDSSGRIVLDIDRLSQKVKLVEKDFSKNWNISLSLYPTSIDIGSYKNYSASLSIERKVFSNFSVGPTIQYYNSQWFFGLSLSYQF